MAPAQLQLADSDPVAAVQLAPDPSAVASAEISPASRHSVAALVVVGDVDALLAATVLDAEVGAALRRFFAPDNLTPLASAVARALRTAANGALCTIAYAASLPATMRCAKVLVSGALVAALEGAASASTVSNAEPRAALRALPATPGTSVLALPTAAVLEAVRPSRDGVVLATQDPAELRIPSFLPASGGLLLRMRLQVGRRHERMCPRRHQRRRRQRRLVRVVVVPVRVVVIVVPVGHLKVALVFVRVDDASPHVRC